MNRKASAITLGIIVMMLMLVVTLGYTAFFVEQTVVRPIVRVSDQETSLKCFFMLTNVLGSDYLRDGEIPAEGTLRHRLVSDTYEISPYQDYVYGDKMKTYKKPLESQFGNVELVTYDKEILKLALNSRFLEDYSLLCFMDVYGPVNTGVSAMFRRKPGASGQLTAFEGLETMRAALNPDYIPSYARRGDDTDSPVQTSSADNEEPIVYNPSVRQLYAGKYIYNLTQRVEDNVYVSAVIFMINGTQHFADYNPNTNEYVYAFNCNDYGQGTYLWNNTIAMDSSANRNYDYSGKFFQCVKFNEDDVVPPVIDDNSEVSGENNVFELSQTVTDDMSISSIKFWIRTPSGVTKTLNAFSPGTDPDKGGLLSTEFDCEPYEPGVYEWYNTTAKDGGGNTTYLSVSETWDCTDTNPPNFGTIISEYSSENKSYNLYSNVFDAKSSVSEVIYEINNTNYTALLIQDNTYFNEFDCLDKGHGDYLWTSVYAIDSNGYMSYTSVDEELICGDFTPPVIEDYSINQEGTVYNFSQIVYDIGTGISSVNFIINNSIYLTPKCDDSLCNYSFDCSVYGLGNYVWDKSVAYDNVGNFEQFFVNEIFSCSDILPPEFTSTPSISTEGVKHTLNHSISDDYGIKSVNFTINSKNYTGSVGLYVFDCSELNVSDLGTYAWTDTYAQDYADNMIHSSHYISFECVDNTPPSFESYNIYESEAVYILYSTIIDDYETSEVFYEIEGVQYAANKSADKWKFTFNCTPRSLGNYVWTNLHVEDAVGNSAVYGVNGTNGHSINCYDTTPPKISNPRVSTIDEKIYELSADIFEDKSSIDTSIFFINDKFFYPIPASDNEWVYSLNCTHQGLGDYKWDLIYSNNSYGEGSFYSKDITINCRDVTPPDNFGSGIVDDSSIDEVGESGEVILSQTISDWYEQSSINSAEFILDSGESCTTSLNDGVWTCSFNCLSLSLGTHIWTETSAIDSAGNEGIDSPGLSFECVDITLPEFGAPSIEDNSDTTGEVVLEQTVTDAQSSINNVDFNIDTGDSCTESASSDLWSCSFSCSAVTGDSAHLSNGTYTWVNTTAQDSEGNTDAYDVNIEWSCG